MKAPDEIWRLGEDRKKARVAKDFGEADRIRDHLLSLGWEIIDIGGEFELKPKLRYLEVANLTGLKPAFDGAEIAIAMIVDEFTEDAVETVQSIRKFTNTPIYILCLAEVGVLVEVIDASTVVVRILDDCGWGQAANAILKVVSSQYVILMDPSTRFAADAVAPVFAQLQAGEFAAVGWRGGLINVEDEWRSVEDKGTGEVDVLFSYFLALNRESALEVGGFNVRAFYYRNADIEFSLRLRQAGGRLLQMDLPLVQARHHGYHDTDPEFREVQSKKNYDRILERFRGKNAILCPRR
ncbi:MAG: hypothetical protein H7227_05660 [Actinobacteria bacterium]|nr:hypothetical protein [Actinomycetota bacterium]